MASAVGGGFSLAGSVSGLGGASVCGGLSFAGIVVGGSSVVADAGGSLPLVAPETGGVEEAVSGEAIDVAVVELVDGAAVG